MANAESWFDVRAFSDDVFAIAEPGHVQRVKSYLVLGDELALLFDTGMGIGDIRFVVEHLTDKPILVVNSHSHWDHIGSNWRFDRIWIHEAEAPRLPPGVPSERLRTSVTPSNFSQPTPAGFDPEPFAIPGSVAERTLRGGESIDLGGRSFNVLHTPGHSPGGICLFEERTGILLVGDAVYASRLYAHLPDSDPVVYRQTIRRLADLTPSVSIVYPAHGDYPLGAEFLTEVLEGNEEIWKGRPPTTVSNGIEQYQFERFAVLLREGWRG